MSVPPGCAVQQTRVCVCVLKDTRNQEKCRWADHQAGDVVFREEYGTIGTDKEVQLERASLFPTGEKGIRNIWLFVK